jgi:hypothetical protein
LTIFLPQSKNNFKPPFNPNLFLEISIYSEFNSIPIKSLPSFLATKPVVPDPEKGSKTVQRTGSKIC